MPAIRRGEAHDLAAVAAIQADSPEAAQWAVESYTGYEFLVATLEETVAGFLVWRTVGPGEREVLNLAVSPHARRKGVGRALFHAMAQGFAGDIFLEVRESNKAAQSFYESVGFQRVGYGPIGRLVARILRRRGIEFTVIEMNLETHRKLVEEGHTAVYGDANRAEVLESAGIRQAESLVLSASGVAGSTEAIRAAREMNAGIHVVARADFLRETAAMRRAGADEVFSGEGEVAMAMTGSILRRLGATPQQLDEAREAIRLKLIEEQV